MSSFKMAIAVDQHHGFNPFSRSQRCRLQSLTHLEYYNIPELSQTNVAHSIKQAFTVANIHRSFSTPCLSLATNVDENFDTNPRIEIVGGCGTFRVRALVVEVAIGMASGVEPIPVSSGLGGAYFLRSLNGDVVAVAKPIDEEPLAFNNPKGFGGLMLGQPGLKRSVRLGETGIRELAAYLLDHGGFAAVPPTAVVKISHVAFHVNDAASASATPCKIASLQCFVDHDYDAGELGPSGFSVASVHRIGIFDVRVLNLDRHAGNILVKKQDQREYYAAGAAELVPIDHGLCLPEWLDDPYFEWLHWPQASVPFSEFELEYISNLDPFKDAELLRTLIPSLRESCIRVLVLCTIFLKRAAAAGLCLADIGEMMTREFCSGEENSSVLEILCAKAKANTVRVNNYGEEDYYSTVINAESKEDDEEFEMFQFDYEQSDDASKDVDGPQLLQTPSQVVKLPKSFKLLSARSMPAGLQDASLSPLYEESDHNADGFYDGKTLRDNDDDKNSDDDDGCSQVGVLTRSMSCSIQNYNCESGDNSFGDMCEGEWELFLERFETLLPEVLEDTKKMGSKQRLGTSCKF
ncbi:PI3_PI4_kinase domain-containing protein [Cephalotus follicularis]|uniref:1-phosphatidylinositol 4-kinase n=1 Tax=Cephalotus follicularis TaxID=3775 RepID=A0A1Q3B8Q1_CEPFO|nr:PI3_PI4_kinase domain-containing protein [Cephalotus follicularis]